MAILSGFFNSVNGDRRYNAAQIGRYLQYIVSDGVFAYNSSSLQVLANDGMEVQVQAGRAMMDCHYMENDAPITLTLNAGGTQDRIDGIIMYVDMTERACGIVVKEGTPAASPVRPALTRTDVRKEYMLAAVRVTKLSSAITQSNITDTRADKTVCGWVTGVIDQVDTTALFAQWKAAYDEAVAEMDESLAAQQQTFEEWYAELTANLVDGTGLPIPTPADVGKIPTVNATGTGYELKDGVTTDKTLTIQGAAADAAAVGRALTVPNLLDNSNFANPVNENGASVYTGSKETITKWISRSGYCVVTVTEDCVNIKSSNGTTAAYVLQFLEPGKIKSGRKYTVVCELKDGSKHCITGEASTSMTEATRYIYVDGEQIGTVRLRYDTTEAKYAVMFSTLSTSGIDVVNVALYEGEYTDENLPLYRPRGYSIEAAICGGAGGLNFKVVGGTTQPTNPAENTIWVNTSTTITDWVFSAAQPTGAPGRVWITVGVSSPVAFNALKKNNITVYPISAKQYVGGAWVDKTAKIYQSGTWADWWNGHLYEYGNQYEPFTGGWTSTGYKGHNYNAQSTFNDDNIYIYATSGSAVGGVGTVNKIDLSGRTKLKLLYDASSANGSHLSVLENKSNDIANAPLAKATLVTGTSQTVTLDITDIAEGYVAITSKTPVYIYDVWME